MEIKADIVDYMGRIEDGVLVLLSINCGGDFSEGTIFYSNEELVLTVSETVEERIGCEIERWEGYEALLESILKKLVPRDEIYGRLDEVDLARYVSLPDEGQFAEEVNPSEIYAATHSVA